MIETDQPSSIHRLLICRRRRSTPLTVVALDVGDRPAGASEAAAPASCGACDRVRVGH
jgi:hypothetical protein